MRDEQGLDGRGANTWSFNLHHVESHIYVLSATELSGQAPVTPLLLKAGSQTGAATTDNVQGGDCGCEREVDCSSTPRCNIRLGQAQICELDDRSVALPDDTGDAPAIHVHIFEGAAVHLSNGQCANINLQFVHAHGCGAGGSVQIQCQVDLLLAIGKPL